MTRRTVVGIAAVALVLAVAVGVVGSLQGQNSREGLCTLLSLNYNESVSMANRRGCTDGGSNTPSQFSEGCERLNLHIMEVINMQNHYCSY